VFQIIPVRFATMIASMVVYGTVCRQLRDTNHANTVVTIITMFSTIVCFLAVMRMISFIKISLVAKHPIMKTAALKGLVAFAILLDLVWAILKQTDTIQPTSTMNKKDLFIGLPNTMICIAAMFFSILIVIPFGMSQYTEKTLPGVQKISVFRAFWELINFSDVLFVGLSCLPNAFRSWKRKSEEGTEVTYYKDAAVGDAGMTSLPPVYVRSGRV
jgi:hypothetical protein